MFVQGFPYHVLEKRLAGGASNQDIFRHVISRYFASFREHPVAAIIAVFLTIAVYAASFIYYLV